VECFGYFEGRYSERRKLTPVIPPIAIACRVIIGSGGMSCFGDRVELL